MSVLTASSARVVGRSSFQKESNSDRVFLFLHPMNETGEGSRAALDRLSKGQFEPFLHKAGVRVIFPDGPLGVCPPEQGQCWGAMPPSENPKLFRLPYPKGSFERVYESHLAPIMAELQATVGLMNVVVGGYSMGGTMSSQFLRLAPRGLAGVAIVRGIVYEHSPLWESLGPLSPPVLMMAGTDDKCILVSEVNNAAEHMREEGVDVTVKVDNHNHYLTEGTIMGLAEWVVSRFEAH